MQREKEDEIVFTLTVFEAYWIEVGVSYPVLLQCLNRKKIYGWGMYTEWMPLNYQDVFRWIFSVHNFCSNFYNLFFHVLNDKANETYWSKFFNEFIDLH